MSGNEVFYEADEEFDDTINTEDREECDKEINNFIFARSKCKAWATKTRNVCTNFRGRVMVAPPAGGEEQPKPETGHQALRT